ncbi:MAG: hypothetical protein Q9185_002667 [Variospora sp. 1 TL-2023]
MPADVGDVHVSTYTQTDLHVRRLVEASIVEDMTFFEPMDSIMENDIAKCTLTDAATVTCDALNAETRPRFAEEHPFSQPRQPVLSVCLSGPNGTGKTSLLMAAVKESGRRLILLQSNTLSSSLVGDSEKQAIQLAPSSIIIDKIEKLFGGGSHRDSFMSRVEGDLLQLWSALVRDGHDVVIFAATNCMKKVPMGIVSRFTEIIEVDVLTETSMSAMLQNGLKPFRHTLTQPQIEHISSNIGKLGPREIHHFLWRIQKRMVVDLQTATTFQKVSFTDFKGHPMNAWAPCEPGANGAVSKTLGSLVKEGQQYIYREVSFDMCEDFVKSLDLKSLALQSNE